MSRRPVLSNELFDVLKKAWGLPDNVVRCSIQLEVNSIALVKCETLVTIDDQEEPDYTEFELVPKE